MLFASRCAYFRRRIYKIVLGGFAVVKTFDLLQVKVTLFAPQPQFSVGMFRQCLFLNIRTPSTNICALIIDGIILMILYRVWQRSWTAHTAPSIIAKSGGWLVQVGFEGSEYVYATLALTWAPTWIYCFGLWTSRTEYIPICCCASC